MLKKYKVTIVEQPTPSTKWSMLKDGQSITITDTEAILPFQTLKKSGSEYQSSPYTLTFDPGGTSTLTCGAGQEEPESTETFTAADGGPVDTGPKLFRRLLHKMWRALIRLFRR